MEKQKPSSIAKSLPIVVISVIFLLTFFPFASSGMIYLTTTVNSLHSTNFVVSTQTFQSRPDPAFIVAGGQQGEWFTDGQYPSLLRITPSSYSPLQFASTSLTTLNGEGSVWSGGFNGSNWLISGWGSGKYLNPYISLYNESTTGKTRLGNYSEIANTQEEWAGGDVFAVGWNGTDWLLTGMGSGPLLPGDDSTNHMSMAILSSNGTFTDISAQIPSQQDLILYANAWNGKYWLVGGGWYGSSQGELLVLSGNTITDITNQIASVVHSFNSIQSIVWNGKYFLIGGVGFLAEYNGSTFTDLTPQLNSALTYYHSLSANANNSVNAIAWMGTYWLLAGGTPVAYYQGVSSQSARIASIIPDSDQNLSLSTTFKDISSVVIPKSILRIDTNSTLLAMSCLSWSGCAIGGADSQGGVLLWFDGQKTLDLSPTLNSNMTYVQWVGLG